MICVPGVGSTKPFSVLVSNRMPDLHFVGFGQCFTRYRYVQSPVLGEPTRRSDSELFATALERVRPDHEGRDLRLRVRCAPRADLPGPLRQRPLQRRAPDSVRARFRRVRGGWRRLGGPPSRLRDVRGTSAGDRRSRVRSVAVSSFPPGGSTPCVSKTATGPCSS